MSMGNVLESRMPVRLSTIPSEGSRRPGMAVLPDDLARKVGQLPPARAHPPRTGERALCATRLAAGIGGWSRKSRADPPHSCEHITQPAFTCRLRWEVGMFVMWDNRLCLHQRSTTTTAIGELYRSTVGERRFDARRAGNGG